MDLQDLSLEFILPEMAPKDMQLPHYRYYHKGMTPKYSTGVLFTNTEVDLGRLKRTWDKGPSELNSLHGLTGYFRNVAPEVTNHSVTSVTVEKFRGLHYLGPCPLPIVIHCH